MIVRYWMSRSVQATSEDTALLEALIQMRRGHIRRLPVLRGRTLCGIISLSDLYRYVDPAHVGRAVLPETTTDYLTRHQVKEVMNAQPITCAPNTPLEEAGRVMRDRRVGALPVMQHGDLVGIITESDVLTALVSIASADQNSKRICLRISNRYQQDIFGDIVRLCHQHGLQLLVLLTHPLREEDAQMVMLRLRGSRVKEFVTALSESPYQTLLVE